MPLVSVIVPNFNHSQYLSRRIESIIAQTFNDFEIIILDDCSTDNSREVIEKFRCHPKIAHIVYNERNSGSTFKQWKKGLDLSTGTFIWIAESDDYSELTFLTEVMKPFFNDENIIISFCQSLYVTEDGSIMHKTSVDAMIELTDGNIFVARKMLGANSIPNASMVVFRKSALQLISDEYMRMRYCGDWLFWVNVMMQGKVAISGKYLNYYLRHNNNVATGAQKKGLDFLEGNKIYDFISKSFEINEKDRINALKIKIDEYLQLKESFLTDKVRKEVLESMLQLDPLAKKLMKKRMLELQRAKYFSKVKKLLSGHCFLN